jgi:hypothetical protein
MQNGLTNTKQQALELLEFWLEHGSLHSFLQKINVAVNRKAANLGCLNLLIIGLNSGGRFDA